VAISVTLEGITGCFKNDVFVPRRPYVGQHPAFSSERSYPTVGRSFGLRRALGIGIPLRARIGVNVAYCTEFSKIGDGTEACSGLGI
jgi:hypothetical protein